MTNLPPGCAKCPTCDGSGVVQTGKDLTPEPSKTSLVREALALLERAKAQRTNPFGATKTQCAEYPFLPVSRALVESLEEWLREGR